MARCHGITSQEVNSVRCRFEDLHFVKLSVGLKKVILGVVLFVKIGMELNIVKQFIIGFIDDVTSLVCRALVFTRYDLINFEKKILQVTAIASNKRNFVRTGHLIRKNEVFPPVTGDA